MDAAPTGDAPPVGAHAHNPDYPDVDPLTGDEAETSTAPHAYDNIEAYIDFDRDADDDEKAPWQLWIPSPDGSPYTRRARSPEPLVRSALKWARDRGLPITVIVWSSRGDQ